MTRLAGFVSSGVHVNRGPTLGLMVNSLMRKPSDVSGVLDLEGLQCTVGWAATATAVYSGPPLWNPQRNVCLLMGGENFANAEDSGRVRCPGELSNPGDYRQLLRRYEEHGLACLPHLNGWFSGVLADLRDGDSKLVLFNDRYGFSRVYIHQGPEGFFFASEAKALLKVLPGLRQFDPQGLGEWFSCGCTLQNRTLFRGVSLLPAGAAWTFSRDGQVSKGTYFQPSTWEQQPALSAPAYEEQLQEIFPRVLRRYLTGSQPVGMSITGGLDGRMIMAWADSPPGQLPCYTFNGPYRDCADVRLGRRVAEACAQPHQVIPVGDGFLKEFPTLAAQAVSVSDGEMDVSGAVELYVNRLARAIAPVRLTGNYGSEILRGNVAFRPAALADGLISAELSPSVRAASATYALERACDRLSFIAFKQVPWHHHARLAVEQSQLTVRSPFLDNDLVSLVYRAPQELQTAAEPSLRLIAAGSHGLARVPTDRGVVYPPQPVLTPLRRQVEEFFIKVEYAMDYGMPQRFAALAGPVLPRWAERFFLGRQKFCHFRTWYRRELAPFLKEVLLDARTLSRPWYRPGFLQHLVASHTSGRRNYTREIHKILSLELLQRQLLD